MKAGIEVVTLPVSDVDRALRFYTEQGNFEGRNIPNLIGRLEATPPEAANAATRALIVKWGGLHAVRTALGLGAVLVYLGAML